jgi:hypothetical protein
MVPKHQYTGLHRLKVRSIAESLTTYATIPPSKVLGPNLRVASGQSSSAGILHSQSTLAIEGKMTYTYCKLYESASKGSYRCIPAT